MVLTVVAYVDARSGGRPAARRPPAWGELSIGAVVRGLLVALGFALAPAWVPRAPAPPDPVADVVAAAGLRVAEMVSPQRRLEALRGLSPTRRR